GYNLLLTSTSLDPERELNSVRALARRRIDGLILLLSYTEQVLQEIDPLIQRRKPLVLVKKTMAGVDVVNPGHDTGAQAVMAHLLELGHRRIGLVYGVASTELGSERLEAYHEGLQNAGIPLDESLIAYCGTTLEAGYRA